MMLAPEECPICNYKYGVSRRSGGGWLHVDCPQCGTFRITQEAAEDWPDYVSKGAQVPCASAWIFEQPGIEITTDLLSTIARQKTPSVAERAAKLLLHISKQLPYLSQQFIPTESTLLKAVSASWSKGDGEVSYLLNEYLVTEGYLRNAPSGWVITPAGHEYIEKLHHSPQGTDIGFCAMWFDERLLPVWNNGIEPAILASGYSAKRIDTHQHNNRIDDEIMAMIRRSRFVVADFTGNRGGVYFEAGFALGLGIPVIWTCRSKGLDRVHFDNRQYAFVTWDGDKLDDFKSRLQNRIEATLGRGPLKP